MRITIDNCVQDDLAKIVHVCPDAFTLEWRCERSPELFVAINHAWPPADIERNVFGTTLRTAAFTYITAMYYLCLTFGRQLLREFSGTFDSITAVSLPPKPQAVKRSPAPRVSAPHIVSVVVPRSFEINSEQSLDDLKDTILRKRAREEEEKEADLSNRLARKRIQERIALVSLCDAFRNLCVTTCKYNFPWSTVCDTFMRQLRISREDLLRRTQLLQSVVPEYISINPPNDIMETEWIRINEHAPYTQVRKKVHSVAEAAREEEKQLTL